jgi:prepilin-type N-terminal cleavage/methylation domain-containing protein
MTSSAGNERGFTLLELSLVILVMALAVAISYPALTRGSSSFQLKATGREILNLLRYAREKAITEQRPLMVVFDRDKQTVVLADEFGEPAKTIAMPNNVRIARLALPSGELQQGPLAVHFLPNGSAEKAEVQLDSDRGISVRIATDPITGGARIITGQREP